MESLVINQSNSNKRIDNLLAKHFKVSKTLIYKLLRTKKVYLNNQLLTNQAYKTNLNDVIKIDYSFNQNQMNNQSNNSPAWLNVKFKDKLNIIYEDKNIILINKPIGILSQPNKDGDLSIQTLLLQYLYYSKQYDLNNDFIPSICNRLDFNTSGIIIAAKNNQALIEINQLIKNHQIDKYYKVLVFNKPKKNYERLIAYHYKDETNNLVYISDKPKNGYKQIITEYKLLKSNQKWSILKIHLVTGKTHQIRAHLNHIGLNLVGETKYKSKNDNVDKRFKTQALVSYKLVFNISNSSSCLFYLNKKTFSIKDIWFEKYF